MSLLSDRMLRAPNKSPRLLLCIVCAVMAIPAIATGWGALRGTLGVNPLEVLIRVPGEWSIILLLVALAIAPLRNGFMAISRWRRWPYGKRVPDWNWFVRLRRPVGLACFFYATAHLALYVALDLDFNWSELVADLRDKPYIAIGTACFVLLLPLAVTSTDGWMRRLKRNWKRLHLLIYPAAVLAEVHVVLLSKPGVVDPYVYGAVLIGLLGYRLLQRWSHGATTQDRVDATVPERPPQAGANRPPNRSDHPA